MFIWKKKIIVIIAVLHYNIAIASNDVTCILMFYFFYHYEKIKSPLMRLIGPTNCHVNRSHRVKTMVGIIRCIYRNYSRPRQTRTIWYTYYTYVYYRYVYIVCYGQQSRTMPLRLLLQLVTDPSTIDVYVSTGIRMIICTWIRRNTIF